MFGRIFSGTFQYVQNYRTILEVLEKKTDSQNISICSNVEIARFFSNFFFLPKHLTRLSRCICIHDGPLVQSVYSRISVGLLFPIPIDLEDSYTSSGRFLLIHLLLFKMCAILLDDWNDI